MDIGLPYDATDNDILSFFETCGHIQSVRLPKWHDSGIYIYMFNYMYMYKYYVFIWICLFMYVYIHSNI